MNKKLKAVEEDIVVVHPAILDLTGKSDGICMDISVDCQLVSQEPLR